MTELVDLSASQYKLAQNCLARWGAKYLGGLEEEETVAFREGKLDHAELEGWSLSGVIPKRPRAKMGVKWAGVPRTRNVELPFRLVRPEAPYRGYIDQIYATHNGHDHKDLSRGDVITVRDWKTTGDIQWAMTEEELLDDVQSNLYGRFAWTFEPRSVVGIWTYLPTKGAPRQVPFGLEKNRCEDKLGEMAPLAGRLQQLYQIRPKWTDLDKNTDFCHSYGRRCPHFEQCKPERKKSFGLLGDANAMADFKKSMTESFPGKKAPPPPPGGKKTPPAPPYKMKNEIPEGLGEGPEVDDGFVNPGGGKLAATPEEAAKNQNISAQQEAKAPATDDLDAIEDKAALLALAVEIGACDEKCRSRAPALRDMIRARRIELKLKGETAVEEAEAPVVKKAPPPAPKKAAQTPTTETRSASEAQQYPKAGFQLLVNCAPSSFTGKVLHVNEIVDAANEKLHVEHKEHPRDYRQIQFGAGPGELAVAVADLFADGVLSADIVILDSRTDEGRVLLNTLSSLTPYPIVRAF